MQASLRHACLLVLHEIRRAVPDLVGRWEYFAPDAVVVAEFTFQIQVSLPFEVILQLQQDALCLGIGSMFWAEYFGPADLADAQAQFRRAALGILGGTMRVTESLRSERVVAADLQENDGTDWVRIAHTGELHFPCGRRRERCLMRSVTTSHGRRP